VIEEVGLAATAPTDPTTLPLAGDTLITLREFDARMSRPARAVRVERAKPSVAMTTA